MSVGIRSNSTPDFGNATSQWVRPNIANHQPTSRSIDSLFLSENQSTVVDVLTGLWRQVCMLPGHRMLLVLSAFSAIFSMPVLLSLYLGFTVEQIQYSLDWQLFNWLSAITGLGVLFGLSAERHTNAIAARLNSSISQNLVTQLWQRLTQSNSVAFQQLQQSDIVSRLTDTMETVQKHQLFVLQQLMRSVFVVLVTLAILLSHHFAFVVIVAFFVFATCYFPIQIAKTADVDIAQEPAQFARLNGLLTSAYEQQIPLRFSAFSGITHHLALLLQKLAITQAGKWIRWNLSFNTKVTLNLLSHVTLLGIGGQLYFDGSIALADLVVVYMLSSMVIPRLDNLYKIYNYLQSLRVGYGKFAELGELHVLKERAQSGEIKGSISTIQLQNVGYQYPLESGHSVSVSGFNFSFEIGKKYFVTGASGSGKSTLINLVMGWLPASEGQILVNGNPLDYHHLQGYWQEVSLQDQSNLALEQFSVLENITLFYGDTSFQSLPRFQHAVQVLEFESCLQKTVSALSGGERQKLSLIRCLIKPASVFIFDEATASMDRETELKSLSLIGELHPCIVIFISHHRRLAEQFDEVIELPLVVQGGSS